MAKKKSRQQQDEEGRGKKVTVKETLETKEKIRQGKDLGIKQWFIKTICTALILLGIVYVVEKYFDIPLLLVTLIGFSIAVCLGFLHEYFHYYKAVKLGYEPVWYRKTFTMGFTIDVKPKDNKSIGRLPLIILTPVSALILVVGCVLIFYGLMDIGYGLAVGGLASLLIHVVNFVFKVEGRSEGRK
jgi:Na+/H+ antiporter NhaD/arsenite permease-like protein